MKHKCKICGIEKEVTQFVKHRSGGPYEPWNLRYCKQCSHDKYCERALSLEKRENMKAASSSWKERNPDKHAEINSRWYRANKEKARAGAKLRYAVSKGRAERRSCEVCGTKAQAHHDSYEAGKELDVRWLCQDHHKAWHMILDQVGTAGDVGKRFQAFLDSYK